MMHALAKAGEFDKEVFRVLTEAALSSGARTASMQPTTVNDKRGSSKSIIALSGCSIDVLADWAWSLARFGLKEVG